MKTLKVIICAEWKWIWIRVYSRDHNKQHSRINLPFLTFFEVFEVVLIAAAPAVVELTTFADLRIEEVLQLQRTTTSGVWRQTANVFWKIGEERILSGIDIAKLFLPGLKILAYIVQKIRRSMSPTIEQQLKPSITG